VIPNDDLGWDDWNNVAMAIWRATAGSAAGFEAFDQWSRKSKKYSAAETLQKWEQLFRSPPTEIGAGTIFHLADEAAPGWRDTTTEAAPAFSEEDLALRFSRRYADDLRYVAAWNKWYRFDGQRWRPDETKETFSLARNLCREAASQLNRRRAATMIASAKTRAAVVTLAGEDRRQAATVDQWDTDLWALNTPEGVFDLRNGERREARADNYMTKITSVAPNADCPTPLWSAFLKKVTNDDEELQKFLARMSGYSLTGLTNEHALFFLYGTGGNGKGVFMNTLIGILGDYHRAAPIETFTETNADKHPTELAMLRGARMVTSTETEEGRRWAESRVKTLTGGDPIAARFMRQDFFEYRPQFKLMISGNHKPGLRSVDEAIRRRFHLIPFIVTIPPGERDKELSANLVAEHPGILHWIIEGCLDWKKVGLAPPDAVKDATEHYLEAEDAMKLWLEECCAQDPNYVTTVGILFERWKAWAEDSGEFVGSARRFSQRLEANGFEPCRPHEGRSFRGLTVYNKPNAPDEPNKPKKGGFIWTGL
jgi:putative DNA primase/helicase